MVIAFPIIHGTEMALRFLRQVQEKERQEERLRALATEAELRALKAQINPRPRLPAQALQPGAPGAGHPSRAGGPMKLRTFDDVYRTLPAVDPHPVARAQAHGGITAAYDGGDAQFAGDNGGVGKWRAHVGDDGRHA